MRLMRECEVEACVNTTVPHNNVLDVFKGLIRNENSSKTNQIESNYQHNTDDDDGKSWVFCRQGCRY